MKFPWNKVNKENYNSVKPSSVILDEAFNNTFITPPQFKYEVKSYPDGSKYVIVKKMTNNLTFRLNTYEDLWILNQIHDVVKKADWKVTVTVPNLIEAQSDRRFDIAQPFGLKLVLEFLKGMENFDYKIFHPHNSEVVEAILDGRVEIIDNRDFINHVFFHISNHKSFMDFVTKRESFIYNNDEGVQIPNNLVVLLPDGGAYKWGVKLMDKLGFNGDVVAASKNRQYVDGKSKLVQQLPNYDFNGKDILIIDDICIYGGTFKGLSKMLKEHNCGKLYLAVSHMTVQNLGENPITDYFDKIYTTNSKYNVYYGRDDFESKNLEIINLF